VLAILVLVVGLGSIAIAVVIGVRRPALRAVAVRNVRRRPGRALLVAIGVLLSTATLTSASVVADSLRSSIRRSAFTQLGPVDEEVFGSGTQTGRSISTALRRAHLDGVDGVLPFVSLPVTVRGRDFVPRVAQAQVIEVDFAAAAQFGGDPSATGISGATPSGSGAVMGADLSEQIGIGSRHRVTISAFGTSRTFLVTRVVPRVGFAGLRSLRNSTASTSPNLFVPPGTIEAMRREARQPGAPTPTAVVAVSNRGGVLNSRDTSVAVTAELRRATRGLAVEVSPVKQLLLDDAATQSNEFGGIFRVFGIFSVLGGILLLLLTFTALARERGHSLGILRAVGLRRRDLIATLVLEALLCCIVGVVLGAATGAGIAALVVLVANAVFSNAAGGGIELDFALRGTSVVVGVAIGLIASLGALTATAVLVSRTEVVALTRGSAGALRPLSRKLARDLGAAFLAPGSVVTAAGILATNATAAVAGSALVAIGATIAAPPRWRRHVAVVGAVSVLVWSSAEVGLAHRAFSGPGPAELLTVAAVMSLAAVTLVSVAHRAIARRYRAGGRRRTAPFALGFAYSHATPERTAIISAMYAVVVFTLCLVVTVGHLYAGNVDRVARALGGNAQLEVTSNPAQPVPARDVKELPGVTRVTGASALNAQVSTTRLDTFTDVTLIGVNRPVIDHGTPRVVAAAAGLRDGLYQHVAADPTLVVVGVNLSGTAQKSLSRRTPRLGDTLELKDPTTGIVRRVHIAGLVADARYEGTDHVYGADALLTQLHGRPLVKSILYVETAPGTNNDTVAAIIDGTHLPNGAYARSFHRLARDRLDVQQQFMYILAGYTALGLLAGAAALAVAMVDRVRERRRQIAMLRAIGTRPSTIRRALRIEAAVIGLEATLAGALAATLLAWRLAATGALGESSTFSVPGPALAAIVATALLSALGATTVAARRAARLQPASALRAEE
jgi:ABC-type lipoprotein release transport system permease subunit